MRKPPTCSTCGAEKPTDNAWCSNGYHIIQSGGLVTNDDSSQSQWNGTEWEHHPIYSPAVLSDQVTELRELLSSIWLYTNWRRVTMQLTTEQRELWLSIIVEDSEGPIDPKDWRWWA